MSRGMPISDGQFFSAKLDHALFFFCQQIQTLQCDWLIADPVHKQKHAVDRR